jgi:hypothetical protein
LSSQPTGRFGGICGVRRIFTRFNPGPRRPRDRKAVTPLDSAIDAPDVVSS